MPTTCIGECDRMQQQNIPIGTFVGRMGAFIQGKAGL